MNDRLCFPYRDDAEEVAGFATVTAQIYDKMVDDISRDIFSNRLLYSLTGNQICLRNVLLHTAGGKKLNDLLHETGRDIYIYGAGIRGKRLGDLFPDVAWRGLIDRNKQDESYHDVKILGLETFLERYVQGARVVVSNMSGTDAIVEDLHRVGVFREDVLVLNDFDRENVKDIYFPAGEVELPVRRERCFVDIGCYDGKDSLKYLEWSGYHEAKVFAFEPDDRNYRICKERLEAHPNIVLYNIGLSDKEEEIGVMGEGEMAYIDAGSDRKIQTRLLDDVLKDEAVGFIKMDVEGYEEHVLLGAGEIIRSQKPVLAVSVYHKKSDIWRLPRLLLEYNGDYCFYMRHYSAANGDTVLYAVDRGNCR